LTLPGTRTVTDPVGTHSDAVLPSDADTARHYRRDEQDTYGSGQKGGRSEPSRQVTARANHRL